jgi:hypothetical protein
MTHADARPSAEKPAARHGRLFELIRQHNLAAHQARSAAAASQAATPSPSVKEFAQGARHSLSPQEQKVLGITSSFGR